MIAPLVDRTMTACSRALKAAGKTPDGVDKVVMVGGSTRIPYVRRRVAEVFRTVPYTALDPEKVVALGAGVQASILAGHRQDMLLLDVTPLSLGIETLGGAMGKLIAANVRIPCQASETFTTFQDGQTAVKVNVLQGERELAKDCRSLGVFELCDVPPMPAGIPKIEVTFLIDQNGILNVSAKEQRSGRAASVQIIPSHGLTRDEVRHAERIARRRRRPARKRTGPEKHQSIGLPGRFRRHKRRRRPNSRMEQESGQRRRLIRIFSRWKPVMTDEFGWDDHEEIGIQLQEKFPNTDPLSVRFTDLHRWICELEGFVGDAKASRAFLSYMFRFCR